MPFTITTDISKIDVSDWDRFLESHPNGTVFQSHSMFELFRDTKNFKPIISAVYEDNKLMAICLGSIISEYSSKIGFFTSRTVIYGGPLIGKSANNPNEILDHILKDLIRQVKNKSIFIQFRNFFEWGDRKEIFLKNDFNYLERLNYLVDTTTEEKIRKRMSKSKLRQVKKGLSEGAEIISPENLEQVKEFYNILFNMYKFKVKKPLPKWSFFKTFYELSEQNKLGIIKIVKYNNRIVGGILSPVLKGRVIYEWYVCGLDQEFKNVYPSVLATWAAIDYANKNNLPVFDFMGVGVPEKKYGVREFKAKFGGDLVNFGRYGRVNNQFLYTITEIGYNILSALKKI